MIIYPPLIKDNAPAFLYQGGEDNKTNITIPFDWNPAVPKNSNNIKIKLQIKDYFTSSIIKSSDEQINQVAFTSISNNTASFNIPNINYIINGEEYVFPTIGQYYKLQIAYDDGTSEDLVYSSAVVSKCISNNILLQITDVDETQVDQIAIMENCVDYKGIYLRDQLNEPLYSYQFDFKDQFGNVLESSEEKIWDNENDVVTTEDFIKSTPTYHLKYEPQIGQTYTMDFTITTINGYSTTVSRSITKQLEESPIYSLPFITKENHDDGYIELGFADMTNLTHVTLNNINGDSRFPEELQIDYSNGSVDNFHFTPEEGWETSIAKDLVFNFEIPQPMGPVYDIMYISFPGTFTGQFVLNNPWLWPGKYELKFSDYCGYPAQNENSRSYWSANAITISRIADQDGDGNSDAWGINGKFSLERKDMNDNNAVWERITEIYVGRSANLSEWTWRDFSAKPGTEYRYRCRQFNNGHYSIANYGQIMCLQSEDIFLSDADRQLKIRFNPKVSSMKETILETKTDTIGSKYPIFYRNGIVRYREIPISGLISYQMDDNQFFMTNEELGFDSETAAAGSEIKTRTTNLISYNIQAEKIFREEVLKWLNNGKPKLFRSPTEGTFAVRLMNVSLSPNDTVGRMLWTFSATAYEMADVDFETLGSLGLLNIQGLTPNGSEFIFKQWRGNEEILEEGYSQVKNIVWSTKTPVKNSYIELTDKNDVSRVFYNYTGIFETPTDQVYKTMKIFRVITKDNNNNDVDDLIGSTINYEICGTVYDSENDRFGENPVAGYWEEVRAGYVYQNVYYLALSRTVDTQDDGDGNLVSKPASVVVNGTIIQINDNQTRYYYELNQVIIESLNNVSGIIYYGKSEGQ